MMTTMIGKMRFTTIDMYEYEYTHAYTQEEQK